MSANANASRHAAMSGETRGNTLLRARGASSFALAALALGLSAVISGCAASAQGHAGKPAPSKAVETTSKAPEATSKAAGSIAECPVMGPSERHTAAGAYSNGDWWPNQLNLQILDQNSPASNPMGAGFDYAKEFARAALPGLRRPAPDPRGDHAD